MSNHPSLRKARTENNTSKTVRLELDQFDLDGNVVGIKVVNLPVNDIQSILNSAASLSLMSRPEYWDEDILSFMSDSFHDLDNIFTDLEVIPEDEVVFVEGDQVVDLLTKRDAQIVFEEGRVIDVDTDDEGEPRIWVKAQLHPDCVSEMYPAGEYEFIRGDTEIKAIAE